MEFDYRLLVKYLIEELSQEELDAVMLWQKENTENEAVFRKIIQLRISKKFENYNTPEKIEKALLLFNKRQNKKSPTYFIRTYLKYAAVILLIVSIAFYSLIYIREESYITYSVKESNEIKKISLSDGTTVWLNNESILKIPKSFSAKKRKIVVDGEAYFDVYSNPSSPFQVVTNHMKIKVLGTSFNIKTDNKNKEVETILVSGKVTLLDKKDDAVIYQMSPGEKVIYNSIQNKYEIESVDTNVSTAWHLAQLTFDNVSLREIANKLTMIFDVNVNLESKKLAERKFRCVINKDESLVEVLEILKYLAPIQYRIEGNEVFISE